MRQFLQLYVMSVNRDVHSLSLFLTNGFGSSRMNLKTDECVGNALNLNLFECQLHTYIFSNVQSKLRLTKNIKVFLFYLLELTTKNIKNKQTK